jgi:hypothetical protein
LFAESGDSPIGGLADRFMALEKVVLFSSSLDLSLENVALSVQTPLNFFKSLG